MSKALSLDLRTRVLTAIAGGLSCRQAASAVRRERVERDPLARPGAPTGRRPPEGSGQRSALGTH